MFRFFTTVALILFFAWCLLPVPSLRSLIAVAMATPDLSNHWTKSDYYLAVNEGHRTVVVVEEPATFDERFSALCDIKCEI